MRRWNGWGREDVTYPLSDSAAVYLVDLIGEGNPGPGVSFTDVIAAVPASRLPDHRLIIVDPAERLRHARGQSLPDWVALNSGKIDVFPDGVAYPDSESDLRELLDYARKSGAHLIPYGGGTSVVGHINPLPGDAPVLTVDMGRLNQLLEFDEDSRLAKFEAGIRGPDLEAIMNSQGYTLGHFPQSFEYSTLGGWVATRSSGQQSCHYGRIEDLFAGGRVETPVGSLDLPPLPASAAGPDLRQLILGSEGRFGLISRAVVRVHPLPEKQIFRAIIFRNYPSGMAAVRAITQARVAVSMLRLSDPLEMQTTLALAGREKLVAWADRGLRALGYGLERCLLIYGLTGSRRETDLAGRTVKEIAREYGGLAAGNIIGDQWYKGRFLTPYLRNTLWERGYAIDTLETAIPWSAVAETAALIQHAIRGGLDEIGERVVVLTHLSHVYQDGASIYVTYIFRRAADPEGTLSRWHEMKAAASEAIVTMGGTISHQHGVGRDHAPYLAAEKGQLGLKALTSISHVFDPDGLLNPGKLILNAAPNEKRTSASEDIL